MSACLNLILLIQNENIVAIMSFSRLCNLNIILRSRNKHYTQSGAADQFSRLNSVSSGYFNSVMDITY